MRRQRCIPCRPLLLFVFVYLFLFTFTFGWTNSKLLLSRPTATWTTVSFLSARDKETDHGDRPVSKRRIGLIRRHSNATTILQRQIAQQRAEKRRQDAHNDPTLLSSNSTFPDLNLHADLQRSIAERLRLIEMTEIQAQTFTQIANGDSVVARSKTGTGKTLAYLVPVLQRLLEQDPRLLSRDCIGALVIVPTRELAIQIADQARDLLAFTDKVSVEAIYGGTKIQRDLALFRKRLPTILISTPGRLVDHVQQTRIRNGRKFADALSETSILILDEADELLRGFDAEMKQVLCQLPRPEKRQTLLFSATLKMDSVQRILGDSTFHRVDVSRRKENGETTTRSSRLKESYVVLPDMNVYISALVAIVQHAMEEGDSKILVFFPTIGLVRFFSLVFSACNISNFELHSKLSQSARTRAREKFVNTNKAVLLSSDVSARGMDYPDVALVVQYGAPARNELHLHRVGRTARAGAAGKALLVLLPIDCVGYMERAKKGMRLDSIEYDENVGAVVGQLVAGSDKKLPSLHDGDSVPAVERAFLSFLAYYAEFARNSVKGPEIVAAACAFANSAGVSPPEIPLPLVKALERRQKTKRP